MSEGWEGIDNIDHDKKEKAVQEAKDREIKLRKDFAHCFSTEQGKAVLGHLVNNFIMASAVELNAANPNYEAAYKNGEMGVVKYILNKIESANHE